MGAFECESYLKCIEQNGVNKELDKFYLWPRTEIEDRSMQKKISKICGACDYEENNPSSRTFKIKQTIDSLLSSKELPNDATVLDITCGDAEVIRVIKKNYEGFHCYGIDCLVGEFENHPRCEKEGIKLYKGYLQDIFCEEKIIDEKAPIFDLVIMLNTYRGWQSADLREDEKNLPEMADLFFAKRARFVIITATEKQISELEKKGFIVNKIGKGEQESIMIIISK